MSEAGRRQRSSAQRGVTSGAEPAPAVRGGGSAGRPAGSSPPKMAPAAPPAILLRGRAAPPLTHLSFAGAAGGATGQQAATRLVEKPREQAFPL